MDGLMDLLLLLYGIFNDYNPLWVFVQKGEVGTPWKEYKITRFDSQGNSVLRGSIGKGEIVTKPLRQNLL